MLKITYGAHLIKRRLKVKMILNTFLEANNTKTIFYISQIDITWI